MLGAARNRGPDRGQPTVPRRESGRRSCRRVGGNARSSGLSVVRGEGKVNASATQKPRAADPGIAVIADSQIGPEAPGTASPRENRRAAHVFRQPVKQNPDFVLHLGDVVHPLPALDDYAAAAEAANRQHGMLACPLHVTPGNHDIGDKTSPWMPAKAVQQDWIETHRQRFGPVFQAFTHAKLPVHSDLLSPARIRVAG